MKTLADRLAPPLAARSLASLLGEELLARPRFDGARVVMGFASAYELFVTVDGRALPARPNAAQRRLMIEVWRQLPPLFACLGTTCSLVTVRSPRGLVTQDLYDRERGLYLDHESLLSRCQRLPFAHPPHLVVDPCASERELRGWLDAHASLGPDIELRDEEDGALLAWARARPKPRAIRPT